jgi:hypothetical protein
LSRRHDDQDRESRADQDVAAEIAEGEEKGTLAAVEMARRHNIHFGCPVRHPMALRAVLVGGIGVAPNMIAA